MLDWLNDSPGFPETQNADSQNREAENPRGYVVFPVSRFSRFKNEGAAQQQAGPPNACEEKPASMSEHLSEPLEAVAARVGPTGLAELKARAGADAERLAEVCRQVLAPPPFATSEDVAELDALMVRLCELEPWLAGYLPEMQAARRSMAPANAAHSLAEFRRFVREAEARRGAVLREGDGKSSALQNTDGAQGQCRQEKSRRLPAQRCATHPRHKHDERKSDERT